MAISIWRAECKWWAISGVDHTGQISIPAEVECAVNDYVEAMGRAYPETYPDDLRWHGVHIPDNGPPRFWAGKIIRWPTTTLQQTQKPLTH